jgi:hypothetical protein
MSRHVSQGVGAGHGHTPKGVSCPVPLWRPFVLVVLDMRALLGGEPYKLDALHLAGGYQAERCCFCQGSAKGLASGISLLPVGPVCRVLSVKLPSHQFDVAGAHIGPVQERPDILPAIDKGRHQDAPQHLHGRCPAGVGLCRLLCCLPVNDRRGNGITIVVRPGLHHPRRERYFKPGHTVALLAHGKPGVLDAAAQFPVRQEGDHRIGRAFLCRRTAGAGFDDFAEMIDCCSVSRS